MINPHVGTEDSAGTATPQSAEREPLPLDVLLVDASALNRSCFSAGVETEQGIRLIACATVNDVVPAAFARSTPHVIILRLTAEDVASNEVADKLTALSALFPAAATILIVPTAEPRHVHTALQYDILGLTTDQLSIASTIDVMRLVHAGMVVYPPSLFETVRQAAAGDGEAVRNTRRASVNKLTGRQYEVLRLLANGLANKEIAQELGISDSTVKVHIRAIMERLGLVNRTQAAASFLRAQT